MKITRRSIPDARPDSPGPSQRRLPDAPAVWAGLAVVGAVLAPLVHEPLAIAAAVGAVGTGCYQLGRRVVRDDPRVAALTADRDRIRRNYDGLLEHLAAQRLDADGLAARSAAGAGGGAQPPAPPAARPSASVRGGGRPGRAGLAPVPSLDDPLDAAAPGTDEAVR